MLRIFAPQISTYGRIVAMTAEEVDLPWNLIPTDARTRDNQTRHPFLKTPTVEIDGQTIYETVAICQYIDDTHGGGRLQPKEPLERARMSQWISIANQYLFPVTEMGLVMPKLIVPLMGGAPRDDLVEEALPRIAYQMKVVCNRLEEVPFLAGDHFSLADVFMFPVLRAVQLTGEGQQILSQLLPLKSWIAKVGQRPSAEATAWPGEETL